MKILFIGLVLIFIFFISTNAYGSEDILLYEKYGFSIQYPSNWKIEDSWNTVPSKVFFKADHIGKSGISIILTDKYEIADLFEKKFIEINSVDDSLLKTVENSVHEACTINKFGPCWLYELLDARIIVINGEKSISLKYSAIMDDQKTINHIIMVPNGKNFWFVVAKTTDVDNLESFEKSIASFQVDSGSSKKSIVPQSGVSAQNFQTPLDDKIILQRNLEVNLILIGEEWSEISKSTIKNNLPEYRDQIYFITKEKTGIRHNYNYNFVSISEEDTNELSKFMIDNSELIPILGSNIFDEPVWQAFWIADKHPEWVNFDSSGNVRDYKIDYRLVDALAVEEYFYKKFIVGDPKLSNPNSVNLVFLSMDLEDANFLRNYSVSSNDDASEKSFSSVGLMGYGGNHNMLFFDLYAAPWIDIDPQSNEYVFPKWIETLHDCNTKQCLFDLISFHSSQALQFVVSPTMLYPVKPSEKYIIDTLIYLKPGSQNTITPATLKYFVNEEKIKKEFEYLYPFVEWELEFSLESRDKHGSLTYDFKKQLESVSHHSYESYFGSKYIQILDVENITPYLIAWGEDRNESSEKNTWNIPVLIEVESSDKFDIYLGDYGVLGIAPSFTDSNEACCAFGVTSQKKVWVEKIGFTDLLIHETGHTLGLMHPFMSTDQYGDLTVNQYFNWYSSPMTYSFPDNGCGILFGLIYSDPCGNASLSFTEFERNAINELRLISLWKDTESNMENLDTDDMKKVSTMLQNSKNAYKKGDMYSSSGSLNLAMQAYKNSQSPISTSKVIEKISNIPDWIKNNAKWWADGKINDDSFVQGIQYLVKENIISIPDSASPDPTLNGVENKIPDWIKNNAKWWANGQISNGDFIKGVQHLVKQGIIKVN